MAYTAEPFLLSRHPSPYPVRSPHRQVGRYLQMKKTDEFHGHKAQQASPGNVGMDAQIKFVSRL